MKIFEAPSKISKSNGEVSLFLAGGICKCKPWQSELIEMFKKYEETTAPLNRLVIYNPRRKEYPDDDIKMVREQIEWEYVAIEECDIFSMFFSGDTESPQPICFYELGRQLYKRKDGLLHTCIVSREPTFLRAIDVDVQVDLATAGLVHVNNTLQSHFDAIMRAYNKVVVSKIF